MLRTMAIAALLLMFLAAACWGPSEATKHNNRGAELNEEGRWEEAIAELDKATELEPNLAAAYNNRGLAYSGLGQHEQALADYDRAIQLDRNDPVAYYTGAELILSWATSPGP